MSSRQKHILIKTNKMSKRNTRRYGISRGR